MSRFILVIAFFLPLVTFTGCISEQDYQAAMGEGAEVVATLREEAERNRQEAAAALADAATSEGEAREAAAARAAAHERLAENLLARSEEINKVLVAAAEARSSDDPGGIVESIGATVLPFLPPGAQGPGVLVIGVGTLIARLVNRSNALKGVIGAIEKAKKSVPAFDKAFAAAKPVIEANTNRAAKAAVDAVQAKRLLPV